MRTSFAVGGQTKEIFESLVTSGLPPEEVLKSLESYGIDWYLTTRGDLMIRYWQVGAEDFVPAQKVGTIQEGRIVPPEANALEWLSRHLPYLRTKYAGQWIAVINNQVIAAATDLPDLLKQVRDSGMEHPFITQIPTNPLIWTTAYAE